MNKLRPFKSKIDALSTPHGALGTYALRAWYGKIELLSTPHGALGTTLSYQNYEPTIYIFQLHTVH